MSLPRSKYDRLVCLEFLRVAAAYSYQFSPSPKFEIGLNTSTNKITPVKAEVILLIFDTCTLHVDSFSGKRMALGWLTVH